MADALRETLETVLVVDDNDMVLRTVVMILANAGFVVLTARSGQEALKVAAETKCKIQLLLSDVDMPLMSGPALGEKLKKTLPDLRVMLMSGGGQDGSLLVLNYGWAFIEKPFVVAKLVRMVKSVLATPNRSQPGGMGFDTRKDTPDPTD